MTTEEDFDVEDRTLCPDGNCTGLLDHLGHCKACGQSVVEEPPTAVALETTADDFEARELCADGSCTGIVGPDRRCKECGKSA